MTKTLIKKQLMEVFAWLYMALMGIVSVTSVSYTHLDVYKRQLLYYMDFSGISTVYYERLPQVKTR